jgi:two-component system, chemotaxis family, sensor kinase CheA
MDNIRDRFLEEANDLVAELEKALLELENNPEDRSQIEKVFRVMHTLKGTSAMFGFTKVGDLTHDLETVYDFIREGKAVFTSEILTITLKSLDILKLMLSCDQKLNATDEEIYQGLTIEVIHLAAKIEGKNPEHIEVKVEAAKPESVRTYYILFRPHEKILTKGSNPLYLLEDLNGLGDCKISAHQKNIPTLENIDPVLCYLYWDIYLATKESEQVIKDIFMFVEDDCTLEIHKVADDNLLSNEKFLERVNEIEGAVSVDDLKEFIKNLLVIVKNKGVSEGKQGGTINKDNGFGSIRVATDKLDQLMNMVSEMITVQARLSLYAEKNPTPELDSIAETMEKISRQLRDNAFSICLIPFDTLLTRFQRLVRDLSLELKKEVMIVAEGRETELDKTIIENLADPLMHLLRNSLDHGIEDAEERKRIGKPGQATITIKAFCSGNQVHIQVKDDGRGIDPSKIKKKAIEKGLINEDASLTEKECFDLIFLPGFSTAEKVTDVSGRGVGMDVVKKKIFELRGEVSIDSRVGEGTVTTIKLPLSLSIIDGLLVKLDTTHLIFPLQSVLKCYEVKRTQIESSFNNMVVVDDEQISFFNLREHFNLYDNYPDILQLVTVIYDNQKVGLVVDSIIGEYQAVLKPLGKLYKNIEIVSGGTILGDGTVALILDTQKIIREFSNKILI